MAPASWRRVFCNSRGLLRISGFITIKPKKLKPYSSMPIASKNLNTHSGPARTKPRLAAYLNLSAMTVSLTSSNLFIIAFIVSSLTFIPRQPAKVKPLSHNPKIPTITFAGRESGFPLFVRAGSCEFWPAAVGSESAAGVGVIATEAGAVSWGTLSLSLIIYL